MKTFTQQAKTILLSALLLTLGYAPGYGQTVFEVLTPDHCRSTGR